MLLAACDAGLDQRLAIVREPRVLAIVSEPAEVKPGEAVMYTALVAAPDGPLMEPPAWTLCDQPKPPTEDNAVSAACVAGGRALGAAQTVSATVLPDACALFGPDVPPGGFRPRDADASGGFYQPVRADAPDAAPAFGFTRVTCNLANAPGDVAHEYQTDYRANVNPTLEPFAVPDVAAGAAVTLTASWPASAAEDFLLYDPESQSLITRHEAMRVSWFATAGSLDVDATATAAETSVSTTWHAPTEPGSAWLWVVLRDLRGGIATAQAHVTIR
jgi:hypothetical protein